MREREKNGVVWKNCRSLVKYCFTWQSLSFIIKSVQRVEREIKNVWRYIMKKKTISILLTLTLVFGLFGALPALAEESDAAAISLYSGSDDMDFWDAVLSEGSKEVTITTADQLMAFMQLAKSMSFKDWTIKLGADIVINTGDASTWGTEDPAYKWGAANKYDYVFASTFDGQGHVISGLYSEGKGFFGYANGNATVKNLSIVNSYFKNTAGDNGCRMGGVVGEFSGESLTIQNVYVSATLEGVDAKKTADCIGGLLGYAQCANLETGTITIENSVFDGKIIGVKVTGGLIGRLHIVKECTIKNSYANVDMNVGVEDAETASISGGLIGQINRCNLTVSDCVVTGTITSKNSKQVSALFGFVTGKINKDDTDYSYTISCSDVLLAVGSASYDSVLGTLDLGTTEAPLNNITWTVENVKYDSSLVAENLPISVGTTTLNATGDTTVNLKGTNAGFTDWAIVENDYPLPVADLIPEIDVDTYKNYVAPVVPGDGNNDNGNNDDGNNDDGNNDSGNNNGGSDTEKATEAKTDANTDAGKTDKNSGCASSMGMTAATVLLLGMAVTLVKKKKD